MSLGKRLNWLNIWTLFRTCFRSEKKLHPYILYLKKIAPLGLYFSNLGLYFAP